MFNKQRGKILNNNLNSGKAKKAENKRLCRELLKKGKSQREIAKILNVSLQTANTYCQEIAKDIEEAQRKAEEKAQKLEDLKRAREVAKSVEKKEKKEKAEPPPPETPEELAKAGFTACLRELKLRLPIMTNEEVMKITVDLWDRVNK